MIAPHLWIARRNGASFPELRTPVTALSLGSYVPSFFGRTRSR
jgi:hypothetical protein